jgi:hypothetical protein
MPLLQELMFAPFYDERLPPNMIHPLLLKLHEQYFYLLQHLPKLLYWFLIDFQQHLPHPKRK